MAAQHAARRGLLLIVCASVFWGTIGVVNQVLYVSSATNALSLTFLRLVIAVPLLFLVSWRSLGGRLFHVAPRDLVVMIGMGCLMALCQVWYVAAIPLVGTGISTLITVCCAPVLIALFSSFVRRERLTLFAALVLSGAVGGTILLIAARPHFSAGNLSLVGMVLALLAACAYASFILSGRLLADSYHPLQINLVAFAAGALLLLLCSSSTLVLAYSTQSWLLLVYLGCIPSALGYVLFQAGARLLPATLTSILTMGEPLTAAVLAWILFHEALGLLGLLGAGLLLGAMTVIVLIPKPYEERREKSGTKTRGEITGWVIRSGRFYRT